ncbi:substrate-binding domain-containing protein [Cohnella thailandensis]|uniref:LacI family DNA-binding transcriptional regulator n=1 Tax=Cohnella thailandensis TaxID=557557 RepID=A0A841SYD2_9BACL|nr:LacI family DNA-binding transcriptional regulator [Cohnella thailandensis]MBP1976945.1 LacI family transcriptional regulator [Cohnella thailandensis]
MTKPTIRDVARLANVSISTVSRVMNAPNTVIRSKQERVLNAIDELKYKPNALARGLIYKKTNTLGVVIPDIRNSYYADIIRGMEDASKKLGYNLIICNTDHDRNRLFSYLSNFDERQVDGILFTSEPITPDYHKELKRLRKPVVLVSTHSLDYELPSVRINDEEAAYDAAKHLIESGHRSIGWIGFDLSDSIAGLPRYQGYIRAHRDFGLSIRQENIHLVSLWSDDSLDAAHRLFLQNPDLTAVFTASDELAIGLLCYLNERGIPVPEQVSVIGFDNIRMSRFTIPKLTTVAQPMYEIGYRSVEKLHARIEGAEDPILREYLPHELVLRSSTRALVE